MIAEKHKSFFSFYEAHLSSVERSSPVHKEGIVISVKPEVVNYLQGTGAAGGFAEGLVPTGLLHRSVWGSASRAASVLCGTQHPHGPTGPRHQHDLLCWRLQ